MDGAVHVPQADIGAHSSRGVRAPRPRRAPSWTVGVIVALFSIGFFASTAAAALGKPFWHDEIVTILFARLPSFELMWRAARDGIDLAPPLNTVVTHLLRPFTGDGPIVTRLPAMAGVWIMCLAVFAIVRRRSNVVVALAAAMLPAWTAAIRYAIEARGYGLMLGCFGLAAFAWSEAASGRRRKVCLPLLALSLGLGAWAHYYGLLNIAPLAAGELVRDVRRRRADWSVWAAFASGLALMLPLAVFLGIAVPESKYSWTLTEPNSVREAYSFLFSALFIPGLILAALVVTALGRFERLVMRVPHDGHGVQAHEAVAGLVCLLIPLVGVAVRALGLGVFAPRYGLSAVVGFCTVVPLAWWVGSGRSRVAAFVICAWLGAGFVQSAWGARDARWNTPANPVDQRPMLLDALARHEQVCVTGLMYLQLWYYTPPLVRARLCYLADSAAARRLANTDSLDRDLLKLRHWAAVSVYEYEPFVRAHPEFLVYATNSGWLLQKLAESGADVREAGRELALPMYHVRLPGPR